MRPPPPSASAAPEMRGIWTVIGASSAGTLIEWYDFYIFGSLATVLAGAFFPKGDAFASLLYTLATFATGFLVRPFGALVFGRIGDIVGRKYAFLVTLLIMGGSTTAIGLLPTYEQVGVLAPILLVALRLLQGLALGGEYGGAATYVAEHAPQHRRGFYTSFIQTTATLGLFVSLGVILLCRTQLGEQQFVEWGWRLPFLGSIVLVVFSYAIRRKLQESPVFAALKAGGRTSARPIRDSFGNRANLRLVLLALFGATMGQGVVWYTGQFYALYFLQTVLKVDYVLANQIVACALLAATPFFVVFGALSDRVGRKPLMLAGCLLAVATWIPIYQAMGEAATAAGGPQALRLGVLVFVQVLYVTLVYGPIAAFLVELFPARIRYTSMSLPYHIGNGVFGGLVPLIGVWAVKHFDNRYAGLWYPMAIASITVFVGALFVRERRDTDLAD
ncbi:MAG: MHS family MFS transporter [Planctomycetes bacterium]|nr:MHS family MFS transporter [Planctomycetota bacterium]